MKRLLVVGLVCAASMVSIRADVVIDLGGAKATKGGAIALTGSGTLPARTLYEVEIAATGTGSGILGDLIGNGDLETLLSAFSASRPASFKITLFNPAGTLPFKAKTGQGSITYSNVPYQSGQVSLKATATLILKAAADGTVSGKAKDMNFRYKSPAGGAAATGDWVVTSGSIVARAAAAASGTPRVDMMVQLFGAEILGNNTYGIAYAGLSVKRGGSKVRYFLVQNDGPSTDSLSLDADPIDPSLNVKFFDGNVDVTGPVVNGTYVVEDLGPGGARAIKMIVKPRRSAQKGASLDINIVGRRVANPGNADTASFGIRVR